MALSMRPATAGAVLFLLGSCGGQKAFPPTTGAPSVSTPIPVPVPVPVPAPAPAPTPVVFPKDFEMPYLVPDTGIYTVTPDLTTTILRVNGNPTAASVLFVDDWNGGVVNNLRPFSLVFLQDGQWKTMSLRRSNVGSVTTLGITENSSRLCSGPSIFVDYANPAHSIVQYRVPGNEGSCSTSKSVVRSFHLDSPKVTELSRISKTFRAPDTGAITAVLARVGGELRRYPATLDSFTTIATGLTASVNLAATATSTYFQLIDATTQRIVRIDTDGTVGPTLFSAPVADTLDGAYSDDSALYLPHTVSGSAQVQIKRIPYNGNAVQTLTTVPTRTGNNFISSATKNAIAFVVDYFSDKEQAYVVKKTASNAGAVQIGENDSTQDASSSSISGLTIFETADNHFAFNLPNQQQAALVDENGVASSIPPHSQWVDFVSSDIDFTRLGYTTTKHAVRIDGFTGDLKTTGHQGGTLKLIDFTQGATQSFGTISQAIYIDAGFSSQPLALAAAIDPSSGNLIDVYGYDLVSNPPRLAEVTHTPDVEEVIY